MFTYRYVCSAYKKERNSYVYVRYILRARGKPGEFAIYPLYIYSVCRNVPSNRPRRHPAHPVSVDSSSSVGRLLLLVWFVMSLFVRVYIYVPSLFMGGVMTASLLFYRSMAAKHGRDGFGSPPTVPPTAVLLIHLESFTPDDVSYACSIHSALCSSHICLFS